MARRDDAERAEDVEWVSATVAADRLRMSVDAVRTMIRRGALPAEKDALGHWRVRLPLLSAIAEEDTPAGTLSAEDAVAATGVKSGLLWTAVHERRLRVVRCRGELRFRSADLVAWLEGLRAPARRRESRSVPVLADPADELLTIDQGAARLGVAPATLWRWLNDAELPFVLAPGRRGHRDVRHVRAADVDELANRRGSTAGQESPRVPPSRH